MQLNDDVLLSRVESYHTFIRGKQYYRAGRIKEIRRNPKNDYYIANIQGASIYQVIVEFTRDGTICYTSCTCSAYAKYRGDCKHIIALLIKLRQYKKIAIPKYKKTEGNLENILQYYNISEEDNRIPVNLEVNYEILYGEAHINLRIGEERLYVVRNIARFLSDLIENKTIEFGKLFTYSPSIHKFNDKDKELIDFLIILYENHEISSYYGRRVESIFSGKRIKLSPKSLEKFFDLIFHRKINFNDGYHNFQDVTTTDEELRLKFDITKDGNDLIVNIAEDLPFRPMTEDGKYFFYKDKIHKLSREEADTIMPIYQEVSDKDMETLRIDKDLKEAFVSTVLPKMKKHSKVSLDKSIEDSIYSPQLQVQMYLDRKDNTILGKVLFFYGDIEINPFTSETPKKDPNKILLRDIEGEELILNLLEESEFKVEEGRVYLEDEELIFDFLNDIIPELQDHCHIYYSDDFTDIGLISSERFSGSFELNNELGMLEFTFDIEDIDTSQLDKIIHAVREKKKYYRLNNGGFLALENEELNNVSNILSELDIDPHELGKGPIQIPKFRAMYLDKIIKDKELEFIKTNMNLRRLVRDINDSTDMNYPIPKKLNADLRDYQKSGFKWLKTLSNYGFGGILADDMGLGKTIQMIAFLLSEKDEKGQEPSIAIVPTSLVYNWEEEARRFAPNLTTLIVGGSKNERNNLIKTVKGYDLIITSYPLLRRDIEEYQGIGFRHCILDEAQHIKNHNSLSAKSVKSIKSKGCFALTGTPMENSISELWSIFDFIMPGYLLSSKKFNDKFAKPIRQENDSKKLKDLNNHIKPFILRRLKRQVLKELPDKIEQKLIVEMTIDQKKLYLAYLQDLKNELSDEINTNGYNKSQMKILTGLTRLRQLCCHPGMFIEDYKGKSGKLESLEEIVSDAIDSNHRILIFSQFTTMLGKIKKALEFKDIKCLYLDGKTPTIDRGELVKDFNRGIGDVFLISLRAGGTGLNLTSADMVIHFDPWWNPAVEDQATDRAHRIGQKNKVQVIKLIAKGTIEEKIFKLQENKKKMIDKVIKEGETLISKLNEEEIMSLFEA